MEKENWLLEETLLHEKYQIKKVLGQGGFGITYLAYDQTLQQNVAIKEYFPVKIVRRLGNTLRKGQGEYELSATAMVYPQNGQEEKYLNGMQNFLEEAQVLFGKFDVEGLAAVKDYFEENGTAYIVMEYLSGPTLQEYEKEHKGKISEKQAEILLEPVINALAYIHSIGIVHCDISPDNLIFNKEGQLKLIDFGAARDYTEFGEKSLSIVLKPGYAPPEQYQTHGVQGPWTDIYALCATMYKCITGENPPDAIERVMDDSLKKISEFGITIPPQEEAAIIKGMSVSAKDRYQDIKDFCEDLYGAYEETPASENKESEVKPDLIKENVEDKVDTSAEETPESGSLASEEDVESEKESAKENREAVSQKKVDRKSLKQYENKEETSVQNVKSEPDNKKQSQPKKFSGKAVLAVILCILLVGGGVKLYSDKKEQQYTLHNPKIEDDSSAKSGKKVSWDCLWFGSYPQSKITEKDGDIYTTLKNTDNWDKNGDATINNIKYHTTEAGYFKYEPIKWRVLQSENGEAFLLSDVILDNQNYNEDYSTWEESSLRSWLNGEFMNRAFSDEEKEKINITEIVNQDNSDYGTEGGNNISDKISLLSSAEADENRDGKKYGFLNDETRKCKTNSFSEMEVALWWLSTGDVSNSTALVYEGIIIGEVYSIDYDNYGVRPALHLNLSSSNLFSYAGTVSSDGNENEVPYNTKTKLVQK